jgi:hypothetical protein
MYFTSNLKFCIKCSRTEFYQFDLIIIIIMNAFICEKRKETWP